MRNTKSKEVALTGMLFALAMALSYLESVVSPLLGLMPGMKLGLANIVVMYALLFLQARTALLLVLLKAIFGLLTRGVTAGFLSLCGGLLSLLVLWLLLRLNLKVTGYIFSVSGALAHNIGQLIAAGIILSSRMAISYVPIELVAGIAVGFLTSTLSGALFPALCRAYHIKERKYDFFDNENKS